MKVLYESGVHSCFGETKEVVRFIDNKGRLSTDEGKKQAIQDLVSSYGCSECVEATVLSDSTKHQVVARYSNNWGLFLIENE